MVIDWLFGRASKEQGVIDRIRDHLSLLCSACRTFKQALLTADRGLMRDIADMERDADSIRREIIARIYGGAFLPYLRPDLCKFVETVDDIFDALEDTSRHYLDIVVPEQLLGECQRIAHLNQRMSEMLLLTFEATLKGRDLREKALAVRIYEKKIDDIKFGIFKDVRKIPVASHWEGESLSGFLTGLANISNVIEDATDHLQIISVTMK